MGSQKRLMVFGVWLFDNTPFNAFDRMTGCTGLKSIQSITRGFRKSNLRLLRIGSCRCGPSAVGQFLLALYAFHVLGFWRERKEQAQIRDKDDSLDIGF
jgi:hypothetical protein